MQTLSPGQLESQAATADELPSKQGLGSVKEDNKVAKNMTTYFYVVEGWRFW